MTAGAAVARIVVVVKIKNNSLHISFVIVRLIRAPAKDLLAKILWEEETQLKQSCCLSLLKWHKAKFAATSSLL